MKPSFYQYIDFASPFALIEKSGKVALYQGDIHTLSKLDDIHDLSVREGRDIVFAIPYCAIRERGFDALGDEPILAITVRRSMTIDKADFIATFPAVDVMLEGDIVPSMADDDYAALIRSFQEREIAGGNASQVTISRRFEGKIAGLDSAGLLSIYRKLLQSRGQYMTILFANVDADNPQNSQYLIGATPERHIEVTGNETIMIPIAGTLRKEDRETFETRLETFLNDPKEINELYQVVDEEMKIMGVVAPEGGEIFGPFLHEIGAVVHTEYELAGKRCMNSIDALRRAMHAPTVVGSPMQSAARIIAKYEEKSRRYYAGEIGIYKTPRTPDRYGDIDTAILIRTAEMFGDGRFYVQAGGGVVRDSIPEDEAKESRAKAMGLTGVMMGSTITSDQYLTDDVKRKYLPVLTKRNDKLSSFWMQRQNPYLPKDHNLDGIRITIINNEDDFVYMIGHMIKFSGANVRVVDTFDYDAKTDDSDILVMGPGPGDPTDMSHPRMARIQAILKEVKSQRKPIFGICLGHQSLAVYEGIPVLRQEKSSQGVQRVIKVFGQDRVLGFYNSFSPVHGDAATSRRDITYDVDENGRIMAMRGPDFVGFQFHPESVMSQDGDVVMAEALIYLKGLL